MEKLCYYQSTSNFWETYKKKWIITKTILKNSIEKCRMVFHDNAVSLFRKTGDQVGYARPFSLQKEKQDEMLHNLTKNRCSEIWNYRRGFLLLTLDNQAWRLKIKSSLRGSHISQRVIPSEKYGQGGRERSSFHIIVWGNVVKDFT